MSDFYDFTNNTPDVKSLILTIQNHGENLVGLELGVFKAESFC